MEKHKLSPSMHSLFNEVAMDAVDIWNPDESLNDEYWQQVTHKDQMYDLHIYIDGCDCIRADVYHLVVIDEKIRIINKKNAMRLW